MIIPIESAGALLVLALTDSLSFGTLLVPVWLLMAPGLTRLHRILLYLGTVAVVYFAIGIVLMAGGRSLLDSPSGLLESRPILVGQLAAGVILLVISFALDTKAARARATERSQRSGRIRRWRERAMGGGKASAALMGLAITAVLVEVASMLPYIAATGIITTQTSTWTTALLLLACYCLVMIAPALALTIARLTARNLIEEPLHRLDEWLTRNTRSTTLWIIGIAGFFLAATAIQSLGWIR
ncbi:GAP family protein [Micromonospora sp. NBC_01412]|uniref:GAP family protein n=1 Tax=Micromonospora sp. NBC_01412 TaxID=2903590 RepID=UPI00325146F4